MVLVRSPQNEHVHIMFEPGSPALQADSLPTELSGKPLVSRNKGFKAVVLRNGHKTESFFCAQHWVFWPPEP